MDVEKSSFVIGRRNMWRPDLRASWCALPYFHHFLIKWKGTVRASWPSGCTAGAVSLLLPALAGSNRLCFLTDMGCYIWARSPIVIFSHNDWVTVRLVNCRDDLSISQSLSQAPDWSANCSRHLFCLASGMSQHAEGPRCNFLSHSY